MSAPIRKNPGCQRDRADEYLIQCLREGHGLRLVPNRSLLHSFIRSLTCLGLWVFLTSMAPASVITNFFSVNAPIPDGSIVGVSDSHSITPFGFDFVITNVVVTLNITGSSGQNGDLYAYLGHGGTNSILLNRVGRTAASTTGYNDSGFSNVRFDDYAVNGDIHNYRLALFGDNNAAIPPFPSPLTGTWAPDGRRTSYSQSLDTDSRAGLLNVFNGKSVSGQWSIFLADVQSGDALIFESWTLEVHAVPEPATFVLLFVGALGFIWRRRGSQLSNSKRCVGEGRVGNVVS
jgi:hypothetical protein